MNRRMYRRLSDFRVGEPCTYLSGKRCVVLAKPRWWQLYSLIPPSRVLVAFEDGEQREVFISHLQPLKEAACNREAFADAWRGRDEKEDG